MKSREDQIFEMFESLRDYSQEPPASVYQGIRKRMWWSGFLNFSVASLNVYYVGALLAAGLAAVILSGPHREMKIQSANERASGTFEISKPLAAPSSGEVLSQPEKTESSSTVAYLMKTEGQTTTTPSDLVAVEDHTEEGRTEAFSEEKIADSPDDGQERAEPLEVVEKKTVEILPSIPYDQAVFSIQNDLMKQIYDPQKEIITLTINEKRKVEEQK